MLFLDEKSDTKTFQYDIEYQKILAEFVSFIILIFYLFIGVG